MGEIGEIYGKGTNEEKIHCVDNQNHQQGGKVMNSNNTATKNLERLAEARNGLDNEAWRDFMNFFVGSLSVEVGPKAWNKSLEIASECLKHFTTKEK